MSRAVSEWPPQRRLTQPLGAFHACAASARRARARKGRCWWRKARPPARLPLAPQPAAGPHRPSLPLPHRRWGRGRFRRVCRGARRSGLASGGGRGAGGSCVQFVVRRRSFSAAVDRSRRPRARLNARSAPFQAVSISNKVTAAATRRRTLGTSCRKRHAVSHLVCYVYSTRDSFQTALTTENRKQSSPAEHKRMSHE